MRTSNFASSHHGHDSVAIHRCSLPNRDTTVLDQILLIKLVLGTPVSSNPEGNERDELSTRRFLLRPVLTVSAVVTSAPSKATATLYCQPIRPTKNRHQLPWPCRLEQSLSTKQVDSSRIFLRRPISRTSLCSCQHQIKENLPLSLFWLSQDMQSCHLLGYIPSTGATRRLSI